MVESHAAKWRWSLKGFFREVGVVQVPNVRLLWHVIWHLLESEHRVRHTDSQLGHLRVPGETGSRPFELVRVFEYHECLGRDIFRQNLGLFTNEILFEKIDLVVLADAV